jgi:hypothetical protein
MQDRALEIGLDFAAPIGTAAFTMFGSPPIGVPLHRSWWSPGSPVDFKRSSCTVG